MKSQAKETAKETAKEIAIEQINEMLNALPYESVRVLHVIAHRMFISS